MLGFGLGYECSCELGFERLMLGEWLGDLLIEEEDLASLWFDEGGIAQRKGRSLACVEET